jgi:hypothetical protein
MLMQGGVVLHPLAHWRVMLSLLTASPSGTGPGVVGVASHCHQPIHDMPFSYTVLSF